MKREEITRSAGILGFITFLSRILGYLRDMIVAYFFGARAETDAFYLAFRIPNLLRRLLAEGSLTVSFVPVFTDYLEKKNPEEAKRVADVAFTLLFLTLIVVSALGVVLSPYLIGLFASGFSEEVFNLAVTLNRIMFPYIFFASLTALSMGILNSLRHFFAPAFAQVVYNLGFIAVIFISYIYFEISVYALAIGVIISGAAQLAFQIPFLRAMGFLHGFTGNLRHPAVKRIALLMAPQLFGVAVYNLNIIVSSQYASHLSEGTVSYLYYSERLIEFPLGIVAVSIATALLPGLSSQISRGDTEGFRKNCSFAVGLMFFVMIPAMAGLIALRVPICNLLYQRGEFDFDATISTSEALLGYSAGLWAVGAIRVIAPTFYAMQDTKTPAIVAFFAFIINAVLGYVLAFGFGLEHTGLAAASSVSSIANFGILFFCVQKRVGGMELRKTLLSISKVAIASLALGAAAWWISGFADWTQSGFSAHKTLVFAAAFFGSLLAYAAAAKLLKIEEMNFLLGMMRRRFSR
ncbi:MAG: murein biosynthesis integral membrane protein MurJ [Deltaproteobacteria bacterium]